MSLYLTDTSTYECQELNRLMPVLAEELSKQYAEMRAAGLNPRLVFEGTKAVWKLDT